MQIITREAVSRSSQAGLMNLLGEAAAAGDVLGLKKAFVFMEDKSRLDSSTIGWLYLAACDKAQGAAVEVLDSWVGKLQIKLDLSDRAALLNQAMEQGDMDRFGKWFDPVAFAAMAKKASGYSVLDYEVGDDGELYVTGCAVDGYSEDEGERLDLAHLNRYRRGCFGFALAAMPDKASALAFLAEKSAEAGFDPAPVFANELMKLLVDPQWIGEAPDAKSTVKIVALAQCKGVLECLGSHPKFEKFMAFDAPALKANKDLLIQVRDAVELRGSLDRALPEVGKKLGVGL